MKAWRRKTASFEICILAGGLSERMRRDKSRLRLGGRSMLGQIRAEAARTRLPVRVIKRDLTPRCGPLGGVYTALKTTQAGAVVFLACDMPFVTARLIEWLKKRSDSKATSERSAGDAIFLAEKREAGFPFLLRPKALQAVEEQIQRAQFSLQALAKVLKAKVIRPRPRLRPQLRNLNTPAEWRRARKLWDRINKR